LATTAPPRSETWRLADIFENEEALLESKWELESEIPTLDQWQGRLAESASVLAEALDRITDAYRRLAALRCYASLRSDKDTRVARHQATRQEIDLLATQLSSQVSYLRPEILGLAPERIEEFLASEPRLEPHTFFLRDLVRQREHVLRPGEERILSYSGLLTGSAGSLYNVLHNAEMPRPSVTLENGESVQLTPVNFRIHRSSPNREDREKLFTANFEGYAALADTLGQNLFNGIKAHLFRARSRSYPSCLAAALDGSNIPTDVYRNLIAQTRRRLPVMHRYFRLRARALGLEKLEYHDLYCPIGHSEPPRFTPDEARRIVQESLAPLGPRYLDSLKAAFEQRWIDWHPAAGKRSGAYATGWAYDTHPYVLLNFTGDFDSVSTLTHEMGHAMHSYFSNAAQPFATADYPVFVAEVASTLNEALLSRRMLEIATEADQQVFLLGSFLDTFRGTLFRQTMFAEFELEIHERVERGEVLTGESLSEIYLGLLRDFHGHDEGVMIVHDRYAVEWAAVPHFYYDFYVYQYATGIVAASALAEAVTGGPSAAVDRYLTFLASGGSDHALDLLRKAGVDLESSEPYDSTFDAFERRLDQLEDLIRSW
jgi:oligoendopeptidase F